MIDETRLNELFEQFERINATPSSAATTPCATWIQLRPTVVELVSVLDGLALIFPQAKLAAEALQAIQTILDARCPPAGNDAASGQHADELLNRLRAATHGGSPAPAAEGSPCEKWASVRPIVVEIVSMLRGLASLSPVLGKAADVLDSLRGLVDRLCGTAAAGSSASATTVSLSGRSAAGPMGIRTQAFKFGRKRPIARGPRLSLRNYIMRAMPAPPPSCDYTAAASIALGEVYLNDSLGDCVIAGMAHIVGVLTGNAGMSPYQYSQSDIVSLYSAIGGYDPNAPLVPGPDGPYNPTDRGCDEQTALNYWQNSGAPGGSTHKIAGWLAVNPAESQRVPNSTLAFREPLLRFRDAQPMDHALPVSLGLRLECRRPTRSKKRTLRCRSRLYGRWRQDQYLGNVGPAHRCCHRKILRPVRGGRPLHSC